MSSESPQTPQWADVQALLKQALELPPAARGPWLRDLPSEYDAVREILRRLLEERAQLDGVSLSATILEAADSGRMDPLVGPGDLIGPYRILRELGSGGMGSVWLAERADGQLRRKFALKLPRLVWAPDLAARVARERDILVSLEHPNIARLYDAGVDDQGRPFLAIEYVEGQRIDVYCDDKRLSVRERVTLLKQIVDAVQYAHTQLVIHRDLKPANVLVNSRGKAILLDFGIASLLAEAQGSEADPVALTVSRAMTPRFASPEQLQGVRLSLTSDVYSLGVMMYDLLAGSTPYRTRNPTRSEFERAVIEGDVRVPSESEITADIAALRGTTSDRLARQLGGDLDAIVAKAMQVNPQARYPSVEAMAADLERWLTGHPVLAKPPSRIDRWTKFTRRNPISVGLGAAAVVLITLATTIAVMQSFQAKAESRRANATNAFLLEMFNYANPELHGGRDITARELLLEGEKRVENTLRDQPEVKAAILEAIANAWIRFGDASRVKDILRRRTELTGLFASKPEHVQSLIDEAQLALSTANQGEFEVLLKRINIASKETSLNAHANADLDWLNGWESLSNGNTAEADYLFNLSHRHSLVADDSSRELRAIFGLMRVSSKKDDRESLVDFFSTAEKILKNRISDKAEIIRRGFEICAFLYEIGELRLGFRLIDYLVGISRDLYGEFHSSQQAVYMYWLTWLFFENDPMAGLEWISRNKSSFLDKNSDPLNYFYCQLIEIRLNKLLRNDAEVKKIINEISSLELEGEERYQRLLVLTEFALSVNDLSKARQLLASQEWGQGSPSYSADRRYYWNLYSGIYLSKNKNPSASERHFKSAYLEGLSSFGDNDFRVGLVYLLKYFVSDEIKTETERKLTYKYLGAISRVYADSHITLNEIRRGIKKKGDSPGEPIAINFDLIT